MKITPDGRKKLSPLEEMVCKYAGQIIGEERIDMLLHEKYRPYWKYGGVVVLAAYLVFGHLGQLISNVVGFAYPAYCSIRAVESSSKSDDTKWLTYWIVFSSFTLVDTFSCFLLSWIPFYWLAKVLFLVWCFSSSDLNGSDLIYSRIILPFFKKHEKKFDRAAGHVEKVINSAAREADKLTENIRTDL